MLRPIAENTFADRQIVEFQFEEILFAEIVKIQKFAEILFAEIIKFAHLLKKILAKKIICQNSYFNFLLWEWENACFSGELGVEK
jgi:hypothetical protein